MIHIVSTFYISNCEERNKELGQCVINNLESALVEKVHIFVDNDESLKKLNAISNDSDKVVIISIGFKPKYIDFFNYILDHLNDHTCMITNADIYIRSMDLSVLQELENNKMVYALSRYEYNMTCPQIQRYGGSHDCYIFHSKFLSKHIINEHTDYYQHYSGIESHIISAFYNCGFKVLNPCFQLEIIHLHQSNVRSAEIWIGLHDYDTDFKDKCWWVPPTVYNLIK
jgi:hypothetical protein|uniref:Glycosyltransferase n=1 Tax=viral metagenome TaxID=1070528 RepID=A0A6C0DYT7_9ZZZZ